MATEGHWASAGLHVFCASLALITGCAARGPTIPAGTPDDVAIAARRIAALPAWGAWDGPPIVGADVAALAETACLAALDPPGVTRSAIRLLLPPPLQEAPPLSPPAETSSVWQGRVFLLLRALFERDLHVRTPDRPILDPWSGPAWVRAGEWRADWPMVYEGQALVRIEPAPPNAYQVYDGVLEFDHLASESGYRSRFETPGGTFDTEAHCATGTPAPLREESSR